MVAAVHAQARIPLMEHQGAVRHVPADHDFSPTTAWEKCQAAHGTYQNGAYWHTASHEHLMSLVGAREAISFYCSKWVTEWVSRRVIPS